MFKRKYKTIKYAAASIKINKHADVGESFFLVVKLSH